MIKKIYLTVLSTNNYIDGVLTLYASLKYSKCQYPFGVFVSKNITEDKIKILEQKGIIVIKDSSENQIPINEILIKNNKNQNLSYWSNTLDKLKIFDLMEFEKIVYLDSDMLVLKNIDELFEKPHLSAVVAGKSYPRNEGWRKLNSGLMVITPQKGVYQKLLSLIPVILKDKEAVGDQDIIQEFYKSWEKEKNLILSEKYNIFINYIDYYVKKLNYEEIKVVHYIGAKKPWMLTKIQKIKEVFRLLKKGKTIELKYVMLYFKFLKKIKK